MHYLKYIKNIIILNKLIMDEFKQQPDGKGCIHCGSSMNGNIINCKVCATLQINGKELLFDGKKRRK